MKKLTFLKISRNCVLGHFRIRGSPSCCQKFRQHYLSQISATISKIRFCYLYFLPKSAFLIFQFGKEGSAPVQKVLFDVILIDKNKNEICGFDFYRFIFLGGSISTEYLVSLELKGLSASAVEIHYTNKNEPTSQDFSLDGEWNRFTFTTDEPNMFSLEMRNSSVFLGKLRMNGRSVEYGIDRIQNLRVIDSPGRYTIIPGKQ